MGHLWLPTICCAGQAKHVAGTYTGATLLASKLELYVVQFYANCAVQMYLCSFAHRPRKIYLQVYSFASQMWRYNTWSSQTDRRRPAYIKSRQTVVNLTKEILFRPELNYHDVMKITRDRVELIDAQSSAAIKRDLSCWIKQDIRLKGREIIYNENDPQINPFVNTVSFPF